MMSYTNHSIELNEFKPFFTIKGASLKKDVIVKRLTGSAIVVLLIRSEQAECMDPEAANRHA